MQMFGSPALRPPPCADKARVGSYSCFPRWQREVTAVEADSGCARRGDGQVRQRLPPGQRQGIP
eukprot:5158985-Pyramimonas_sp.AAC.1